MIDDSHIDNLAKSQVSAVLPVIRRTMSPKFIVVCMEAPCLRLCLSKRHKHGGRKITKTSVVEFCYLNENFYLELQHIEIIKSKFPQNSNILR